MPNYRSAAIAILFLATPAAAQPTAVAIDVTNFAFAPSPLHLAAGRPVTLTFVNRSSSRHDFTARAFFAASAIAGAAPAGGKIDLAGHQSRSITLTPRAGNYTAHCGRFMHKQFGMSAVIIVH